MNQAALAAIELIAQQRATSTVTGGDVDLSAYTNVKGRQMKAILSIKSQGADTDETCTVKIQESDDTVSGNFADITGAAFAAHTQEMTTTLYEMGFRAQKRYVRAVATLAGTTIAFDLSVCAIVEKRFA